MRIYLIRNFQEYFFCVLYGSEYILKKKKFIFLVSSAYDQTRWDLLKSIDLEEKGKVFLFDKAHKSKT